MNKFRSNIFFDTNYLELLLVFGSLQNSDFQSQFSMSRIIWVFLIYILLKNIILGALFSLLTFFENLNFLFSKNVPIFVGSEVVRCSLYQKSIGAEVTHLYISSLIVLGDYCDLPQPWTP